MSNIKKRPVVWSMSRGINVSEGILSQTVWTDNHPVYNNQDKLLIVKKDGCGVHSNFKNTDSLETIASKIDTPNPFFGEGCFLDHEHNTIRMDFGVKVIPVKNCISSCYSMEYQTELLNFIQDYDYTTIAARYINNIVNGKFWWRNRFGASAIEVVIGCNGKKYIFDALAFNQNEFYTDNEEINEIAAKMADAFSGRINVFDIRVISFLKAGYGAEVFPSQEMKMDVKEKLLFKVGDSAGMHSQKIGNAIRAIDTWYPEYENYGMPIAIEPYGVCKNIGKAFRMRNNSFFSILDSAIIKDKKISEEEMHYVMACIIRGGVFGIKEGED